MNRRARLRLVVLRVLVVSLFATLIGRLWTLQVLDAQDFKRAAAANQLRQIITPAPRGLILDDTGRPLAANQSALVISVDRFTLLRQRDGGVAVLKRLAKLLHTSFGELNRRLQPCSATVHQPCWNGSPYQPVPVEERASVRTALQIMERKEAFPGVSAQLETVRYYPEPMGASAAQTIGYLGPITQQELNRLPAATRANHLSDLVGREGLEANYNRVLRGVPGVQDVSVDHLGDVTSVVGSTPPVAGDYLVTSINAALQRDVEQALRNAIASARLKGLPALTAAGVVLDAQTGHVLALASIPTYDPNMFAGGVISTKDYERLTTAAGFPLDNWATDGQYSPGSTFKLITASTVLSEGDANEQSLYPCPSSMNIGGRTFSNNEGESGGDITLHEALVMSCDTVFYGFALQDYNRDQALIARHRRPIEALPHMAMAYGVGHPTGIDIPGEAPGYIETRHLRYETWLAQRKNWCAGARRRPPGSYVQQLDQEDCTSYYLFEPGDQANMYIGQGTDAVTPLQLANAYAAMVNGGRLYEPRIGEAVVSPTGRLIRWIKAPVRRRLPVRRSYLNFIKQAMYGVTHDPTGTAAYAFTGFPFNKVDVGGKTGTAEVFGQASTSWFASFAGRAGQPARYVCLVVVPHGRYGAETAAPAVREIWDGLFGLEGHRAALPGGREPGLPHITPGGISPAPPTGSHPIALSAAVPPVLGRSAWRWWS